MGAFGRHGQVLGMMRKPLRLEGVGSLGIQYPRMCIGMAMVVVCSMEGGGYI